MTKTETAIARVLSFDDPLPGGIDTASVLGGKAAGLAVMVRELGLPVPPGFVVTTAVCRDYMEGGWPAGLDAEIEQHLEALAAKTGRRFGDASAPLLVSVRSGAPVSMPGMMDTLLNVGMTAAVRERLAEESGSPVFAADTWLRFCRMYAETVLNVPRDQVATAALHDGTVEGILAAAGRVWAEAAEFGGIPADPRAQLRGAVEAVFRSWGSERANVFRRKEGIADSLGTAATIQAMVFGNLDDRSGTGVAFTRDPASGANVPFGDYLARAQGEDVVAGTHAVQGLEALAAQLPDVHTELMGVLRTLERHYRDMCDVEFTVSGGRLYVLQTRVGRRSPLAAVRIAVEMARDEDFPLTRAEAIARIDADSLQQLAVLGRIEPGSEPFGQGLAASPGVGVGALCCDPDRAAELASGGKAVVLARPETSPADVHGMVASAGLVTTLGGVVSHAAVVARGWAIPAICSLAGATVEEGGIRVGGVFVAEGETVTVDGTNGVLYRGDCRAQDGGDVPELRTLREWAAELSSDEAAAAAPSGARAVSLFEIVRTVQLKGLCAADRAAASLHADAAAIESAIAANEPFFKTTPRGYALTPEGRAWAAEQLRAEAAALAEGALEPVYERFVPLNTLFKQIVSEWQIAGAQGERSPDDVARLAASIGDLHAQLSPLVVESGEVVARLAGYGRRFAGALAALQAGDATMLASPMKDSYHTVWFEYHEELIALTGRDRANEEM
jgi:pyruvate,orthophosphate dikinase